MMAQILGTNIHHEVVGDGPVVMFVHGLGGTSNVWHAQKMVLQKFFKVVTLDLPGSGRSEKGETSYTMERWADQLVGLADHLKIERFTLVGHSMTTILAQKSAAKYPHRINGLVLCGAMTELPAAGKEAFTKRAETALKEGMGPIADVVLQGALSAATREANAVLAGLYREVLLSNDPPSYAAQCRCLIEASARSDQAKIQCPTLVMVGDQDVVTPLANARAIAAAISKCTIRVVLATAHLTMAERPAEFNAALIEFLSGLE